MGETQRGRSRFRKRRTPSMTSPIVEPKPSQNQPVSPTVINPEVSSALIRSHKQLEAEVPDALFLVQMQRELNTG